MKEIKLISIEMENFKCFPSLKIDFNGRNTSIYADNAGGKTTIFDAFTWVLFSKSSKGDGDKSVEVKPLGRDGEVLDHEALTSVEVVLSVNGVETSLRRTYREVWETRRGSSDLIFSGNTSEYYIDGVPVKKNAFQAAVNEIIEEETFRLLTSTDYFAKDLNWQERRAVLFRVAGVMDDQQILESREAFRPLLDGMGRLSLEDYKKKLLAEKKKYVGAKTEIPARISECQKTIEDVKLLDFAAAHAEVDALRLRQDSLAGQLAALEHDAASEAKRVEIREAKLEMAALAGENDLYRGRQSTGAEAVPIAKERLIRLQTAADGIRGRIDGLLVRMSEKRTAQARVKDSLSAYDRDIEAARSRWISVNGETFTAGNCPTCGQALPADQRQKAMDAFEANKAQRLQEIQHTASAMKASKEQAERRISEIGTEIDLLQAELASLEQQKLQADADVEKAKEDVRAAEAAVTVPQDMPGYTEKVSAIEARITKLSGELMDLQQNSAGVKADIMQELSDIKARINAQLSIISKESLLEYSRQRMEDLRADAKSAAECLEAIERQLFLMDEYSRYKTRFVEDSINGLFRIARFRLFREQANGGIEDRCDVVLDGVPYISVNNGAKINVGIDIINTLSNAYGVRVPLFVDNAESVTKLEASSSQIIRLVVSENDKELRVNYEN